MASPTVPSGDSGNGAPTSTTPAGQQAEGQTPTAVRPTRAFDPPSTPEPIRDRRNAEMFRGPAKDPKINPLPGVIEKVERGEEAPEERAERLAREEGRPRDEQGRFLPKQDEGERAERAPEQKTKPAPAKDPLAKLDAQPEDGPPEETAAQKQARIQFLGKEYPDIKEVEHLHKTLQGNFKTLKDTAVGNYNSANAWKAEAERLAKENEDLRAGKVPAGQPQNTSTPTAAGQGTGRAQQITDPNQPAPEPKSFAEAFDWNTYNRLKTVDPEAAEIFKESAWDEYQDQKWDRKYGSKLNELAAPREEQKKAEEFNARVVASINELASQVDPQTGVHYYPELQDEQARNAILQIWSQSGVPPELAHHPYVIASAVAHYRNWRSSQPNHQPQQQPSAASQAVAQGVVQEISGQIEGRRQSGVVEPPPSPALRPSPRSGDPAENFKLGIRQAGSFGDGKNGRLLGVMP